MKTHPLTRKHWYIVALAAVVLGLFFVAPFIGIVALATLMAFLFHGIYDRLVGHMCTSFAEGSRSLYQFLSLSYLRY